MGLLSSIGTKIKGLLGDEAFLDRLEQAKAFSNGDHIGGARIAARIRDRRARQGLPLNLREGGIAVGPDATGWPQPQLGQAYHGYTYVGGDPRSPYSWGGES